MKESISATTLFQIVILFILLFTGIMCLTINNANAFGVKDEIINIIELSDGNFLDSNNNLNTKLVNAISEASYRTTGTCSAGYTGYLKDGTQVSSGSKAAICIKEVPVTKQKDKYYEDILGSGNIAKDDFFTGSYYQIEVFYQLDIPIVNQVFNMRTKGETRIIYS